MSQKLTGADCELRHDRWLSRCDWILDVAKLLHAAEFDTEPAEDNGLGINWQRDA